MLLRISDLNTYYGASHVLRGITLAPKHGVPVAVERVGSVAPALAAAA